MCTCLVLQSHCIWVMSQFKRCSNCNFRAVCIKPHLHVQADAAVRRGAGELIGARCNPIQNCNLSRPTKMRTTVQRGNLVSVVLVDLTYATYDTGCCFLLVYLLGCSSLPPPPLCNSYRIIYLRLVQLGHKQWKVQRWVPTNRPMPSH